MSSDDKFLDWDPPKQRIPVPSDEKYMLVRTHDFQRLRKRVAEELSPRHENIPAAYFTLFGAAVATGVSVPPLLRAHGLPSWIASIFIVSAGAFLVLGLILVFLDRTLKNGQKQVAAEVAQEMLELEESCRGEKFSDSIGRNGPGNMS